MSVLILMGCVQDRINLRQSEIFWVQILAYKETKVHDALFPVNMVQDLGYHVEFLVKSRITV